MSEKWTFKPASSWPVRIWIAVSTLCVCFILAQLVDRSFPGETLLILFSGTVFVALFAGFWPASGVAILSILGQSFFFQAPRRSLLIHSPSDLFELILFLLGALFLSWVGSLLRSAYAQAESSKKSAESASRAREDLLAMVSHDLKNPLHAIRINSQLLSRQTAVQQSGLIQKGVDNIQRSSDRAIHLIQDLLDFEKIRMGLLKVELRPSSLRELVDEVQQMMRPIAASKAVQLEVSPPIPEGILNCDPERLIQMLGNLVGNAIKFTAEGGWVRLECSDTSDGVRFVVRDNGPGIAPEHLPHLFDRYWQVAHTARQGTGLGLAIVKGIVEAHQGRIEVTSQPGEGSLFSVFIPNRNISSFPKENSMFAAHRF